MKKNKLSPAVMSAKDRVKKNTAIRTKDREKHDTAFRIRLGKDEAGTQFLEIRFRERRAIIAATDLLLTRRELAAKLIAQGVPVFDHRKLRRLESAAQRAIEAPEPAFTLVSRPGWIGGSAFAHGMKLVGSLPRDYVFHAHGLDLGDRPAKFGVRGSLKA